MTSEVPRRSECPTYPTWVTRCAHWDGRVVTLHTVSLNPRMGWVVCLGFSDPFKGDEDVPGLHISPHEHLTTLSVATQEAEAAFTWWEAALLRDELSTTPGMWSEEFGEWLVEHGPPPYVVGDTPSMTIAST